MSFHKVSFVSVPFPISRVTSCFCIQMEHSNDDLNHQCSSYLTEFLRQVYQEGETTLGARPFRTWRIIQSSAGVSTYGEFGSLKSIWYQPSFLGLQVEPVPLAGFTWIFWSWAEKELNSPSFTNGGRFIWNTKLSMLSKSEGSDGVFDLNLSVGFDSSVLVLDRVGVGTGSGVESFLQ